MVGDRVCAGRQFLSCVPVFGAGTPRLVTVVKGGALGTNLLGKLRDLHFHPLKNDELWVASASPDGRLDGNFIIKNPGTAKQTVSLLRDRVAYHYMENVAAFAFSADGRALFLCNEADNTYMELANANFFQGPTAYEVPCISVSLYLYMKSRPPRMHVITLLLAYKRTGVPLQGRLRASSQVVLQRRSAK